MWNAQVWIKWNDEFLKNKKGWEWLKEWKEVTGAWSVMGDWDMLLNVEVKSPEELETFIWNKLRKEDWVKNTHTTWARQVWWNKNAA